MQERKTRNETGSDLSLPRPFYEMEWPTELRQPVRVLWNWHTTLQKLPFETYPSGIERFATERERILSFKETELIPKTVSDEAYNVVKKFHLPIELLADQVVAAKYFYRPIRFLNTGEQEAFIQGWAVSHGRLLAHFADAAHSWQGNYVEALSFAFYMIGRLIELPKDAAQSRIFIPEDELSNAGVTVEDLRKGKINDSIRRLLWKQTIRVRDALVRGMPLIDELRPRFKISLSFWWQGGLEALNELERRDFDVWSKPLVFSTAKKVKILLQSLIFHPKIRKR